ncbi:MAG TPA: hypothetical protein VF465_02650 [Flavobacterium sp.]|uniref:hypothetical protein n=1 Tax=Flavobacterium sp. TaxID=239 RepID=UPI002ED19863
MRTNTNGKSLSSVFILWLDAFIINQRNKDNKIKITKMIFATILNIFIVMSFYLGFLLLQTTHNVLALQQVWD